MVPGTVINDMKFTFRIDVKQLIQFLAFFDRFTRLLMCLFFAVLAALGSAKGRYLRRHRSLARNVQDSRYNLFVTLWKRVMNGGIDFQNPEVM